MFPHSPQSAVPPDKLVQQMIVQALQAFYIQDYETGKYFLEQIRANLPRYMYQINPQLRTLCKEIVKLIQDGSMVPDRTAASTAESVADTHPGLSGVSSEYTSQPEQPEPTEPAKPDDSPTYSEPIAENDPSMRPVQLERAQVAAEMAAQLRGEPAPMTETDDIEGFEIDVSKDIEFEPQSESLDTPVVDIPEEDTDPLRGQLPTSFINELSSAVNDVKDKKKKKDKEKEKLVGSMDELDEFDF